MNSSSIWARVTLTGFPRKSLPAPKYCLQLLWGRIKTGRIKNNRVIKMKKQIFFICLLLVAAIGIRYRQVKKKVIKCKYNNLNKENSK